MIEAERYRLRMTIAIFRKFYDDENPIVADADEVRKLREFNKDVMDVPDGTLKGPITVYGVPVVDANGKPWVW
jgi:hypothetical protein